MKKLFTFKNCLIIFLLLSIIAYLIALSCLYINDFKLYNAYLNSGLTDLEAVQGYTISKNICLTMIITNIVIILLIAIFLLLFLCKFFNKYNCLKFGTISLILLSFFVYMLQTTIHGFLQSSMQNSSQYFIVIAITSLIALIIGIACYIYLLIKEIKKRKAATQVEPQEHIVEETTQE